VVQIQLARWLVHNADNKRVRQWGCLGLIWSAGAQLGLDTSLVAASWSSQCRFWNCVAAGENWGRRRWCLLVSFPCRRHHFYGCHFLDRVLDLGSWIGHWQHFQCRSPSWGQNFWSTNSLEWSRGGVVFLSRTSSMMSLDGMVQRYLGIGRTMANMCWWRHCLAPWSCRW
jgi:hypothetical protein